MPDAARARTGLRAPSSGDGQDAFPVLEAANYDGVENLMAVDRQGTLAARGLASAYPRSFYFATDVGAEGALYRSTGVDWRIVVTQAALTGEENARVAADAEHSANTTTAHGGSTGTGLVVRANSPGIGPLYCEDIRSLGGAQAYQSSGTSGDFNQGYVNLYGTVIAYRAAGAAYDNMRAAAFIVTSDARLKNDVEEIRGALGIVESLRGVYHGWSDPGSDRKDFGLIAQEVQETVPELVTETVASDDGLPMNGMLGIDYARLVPILVEAVKDLSGQVKGLTARISELEVA